ncbi:MULTISPECIES: DUF2461 domain-containing protein [Flavobacterium]|jgi:uncharacterized protein (TIGR02453 family)|uniref:DUF2461 domain-containing protein n=1 Tax=Flavobacterium cupriresistens TaxID=2893885 RepID=A0ABU4RDI3_9FLAO|nr:MULTISPECIES: DUF2461 domain-containing protein [unclassified Flavobacterium]KLT69435.1 hypothetical protein AB674_12315 [Flavobacterium sp. ABG]MDX6190331.1 DUF2461 domain-containing protein [Flavobacterium sp. Fl-318]UFH43398.1 DUF2461 domain-containing protein [Flavobacterium sp. F-323]
MKNQITIPKSSLDFLQELKANNNKPWFDANKTTYLNELNHIETFAGALLQELSKTDVLETASGKKSVYRIYRDIRFSKDKTPFKSFWGGSYTRATSERRGGYYYHLEQGNSFIAGGFWGPNAADLKRVRSEFAHDPEPMQKILHSESFIRTFGTLQGEQLKTKPKGFDIDHEAIDLLRYKQFLLIKRFTDQEVLSPLFLEQALDTFKNMRPFFDYMSEILTTDINGASIL